MCAWQSNTISMFLKTELRKDIKRTECHPSHLCRPLKYDCLLSSSLLLVQPLTRLLRLAATKTGKRICSTAALFKHACQIMMMIIIPVAA
jgi:hypothetical protein